MSLGVITNSSFIIADTTTDTGIIFNSSFIFIASEAAPSSVYSIHYYNLFLRGLI
jgi:hypothetical protein